MILFEERSTYDASLDPVANVTILIECHPSVATSVIDHIGKLEGKVYSANVSQVVIPGAIEIQSSSTTTKELENVDQYEMQMRRTEESWGEILPGMPRSFYAELEKIPSSEFGAEAKGQLQELCKRIFEAGENPEVAMREVWGDKFTDAPSRLQQAVIDSLAVPETPSGIASIVVKVEVANVEPEIQRSLHDEGTQDGEGSIPSEGGIPEVATEHLGGELAGTSGEIPEGPEPGNPGGEDLRPESGVGGRQ